MEPSRIRAGSFVDEEVHEELSQGRRRWKVTANTRNIHERCPTFYRSCLEIAINDLVLQCWNAKLVSEDVKVRKHWKNLVIFVLHHVPRRWNDPRVEPALELFKNYNVSFEELDALFIAFSEPSRKCSLEEGAQIAENLLVKHEQPFGWSYDNLDDAFERMPA